MALTLKEWDEAAEGLTPENAQQVANAIQVLEKVQTFKENFGWTGLFALKYTYQARADKGNAQGAQHTPYSLNDFSTNRDDWTPGATINGQEMMRYAVMNYYRRYANIGNPLRRQMKQDVDFVIDHLEEEGTLPKRYQ